MSDASSRPDGKDERIRLLEYQAEFLRRELAFVSRCYDDIRWSAAWTMAKPLKRVEDALHRLVRRFSRLRFRRTEANVARLHSSGDDDQPASPDIVAGIAARITAATARPPTGD